MVRPIDLIPGFGPTRHYHHTRDGWVVSVTPPDFMGAPTALVYLTSVQFEKYQMWLEGKGLIQDLLPDLSLGERELLISGLELDHPAWKKD